MSNGFKDIKEYVVMRIEETNAQINALQTLTKTIVRNPLEKERLLGIATGLESSCHQLELILDLVLYWNDETGCM